MTDDPFDDEDRTVLRPSNRRTPPAQQPPSQGLRGLPTKEVPLLGGINSLEKAASGLLPLLISIKNTTHHPDPQQLRNKLIRKIEEFKNRARRILDDPRKANYASYVMCTVLDEAAMNTPWGEEANWAQDNLLVKFHGAVIGGEQFFKMLQELGKNPAENIELLELMYVCLSLGYEGTNRIAQNGQERLAKIKIWLYETIQSVRRTPEPVLAHHWQGSDIQESTLPRLTPLWVGLAAALALCSIVYFTLLVKLGEQSDDVIKKFMTVDVDPLIVREIAAPIMPLPVTTPVETLTQKLQAEINSGDLAVFEEHDHGKIRLVGDNLFASGRASINQATVPLLTRISDVLVEYKGKIIITGHSDNIPIRRSAKHPSNIELSRARAESVIEVLSAGLTDRDQLSAVGKGENEPIADNSIPSGRRENRRVEITVYY